jgi:hypothetical protein
MSEQSFIEDNLGRKIFLKKPSTLERVNFFRILGSDDCSNNMVLAEFSNAMWVAAIDDRPISKKQLVDIEYICNELDKSNANDLILQHRIGQMNTKKDGSEDVDLIKK